MSVSGNITAAQVLSGAVERIQKYGWLQGCYAVTAEAVTASPVGRAIPAGTPCGAAGNLIGTEVGATDVIGALRQSKYGRLDHVAVDEAKAVLRRDLGVDNLADWNDEPGRTKEQVIAALKAAAKRA